MLELICTVNKLLLKKKKKGFVVNLEMINDNI